MRKHLLLGIAAFAVAPTAPTVAADLSAPPFVSAPVHSWAGFYVGANAGYTWSARDTVTFTGTDTGVGGLGTVLALGAIPSSVVLSSGGFIGGVQAGYNWQSGFWVYGIEADFQWADAKDSFARTTTLPALVPITTSASRKLQWLGTLRARAGVTVTPTLIAYMTGGMAYGEHELTVSAVAPAAVPSLAATTTSSKTSVGWTIGGGIEYAFIQDWSLKAEYLYYDLGRNDATILYNYGLFSSSLTAHSNEAGHIVRAGINRRF